jgi:NAD(P)-dependent dehydrogenase (short-subunit alcohol dehydrogenase family)
VVGDVRREEDVQRAVDTAVEHFGGVDIAINNASAVATEPTEQLAAKKFDLMMDMLLSLGWAAEYADAGVGFSCLWPETYIATAALTNLADGDKMAARSRSPEIMADAAVEILSRPPADVNGKCFIDSAVLAETGVTDLSSYGGGDDPILDIFVDKP